MAAAETISTSTSYSANIAQLATHSERPSEHDLRTWRADLMKYDLGKGLAMAQQALDSFSSSGLLSALENPRDHANNLHLTREAQALTVTGNATLFLIPAIDPSLRVMSDAGEAIGRVAASARDNHHIDMQTWDKAMNSAEALNQFWLPPYSYSSQDFREKVAHYLDRDHLIANRLAVASLSIMPSALNPQDSRLAALAKTSVGYVNNAPSDVLAERLAR